MSPARRPRGRPPGPTGRRALRVVAGELAGRRFDAPPGTATRPTSDRIRESVFNALESRGAVSGAQVLDAFAGSGALGIEALSRGAQHAVFAETDPEALVVLRSNVQALGLAGRIQVLGAPAERTVRGAGALDLVLLDPPYAYEGWSELLEAVAAVLAPEGVVVIESDREVEVPATLRVVRSKRHGGTVVQFATPVGAPS